ncbi:ABC transporter ATP-binding protein [Halobacteriovorax vibrionivorans]|uniref:ABC transporter ATP-binding protein n=1 Tax=Halobacteriovorax vibrionivorans TaxID=2152716 RepID=A0ABY0IIQ1_9BACT|nr:MULTISPECIES: ABC transporter ATP-binding protein [Halobacteriovorax]RZF22354.1 ABC transporter ATP-binding protein [Halobacteriovorax vibrionivorans]TGD48606.1 ABC transporter ATP-binding protein [Halobacteriovorax sp. Y22]
MKILEVNDLTYNFDRKSICQFDKISFDLHKGEVLTLLGPSGTGKTTLFNILCDRLTPLSGEVKKNHDLKIEIVSGVDGLNWDKTVFENIEDHLLLDNPEADSNRVRDMIEIFGLEYKDHKRLDELSAGQLQRLLFARSMVISPDVLLLDEPFSNIDEFLKATLCHEIFEIFKENEISLIFITHNLKEAYSLSDRLMYLSGAKLQVYNNPYDFYRRPLTIDAARFGGLVNLVAGPVTGRADKSLTLKNDFGQFEVIDDIGISNQFAYLAFRPKHLKVTHDGDIKGRIKVIRRFGEIDILEVASTNSKILRVQVDDASSFQVGQQLSLSIDVANSFLLPV